jgi:PII-like signaling protein
MTGTYLKIYVQEKRRLHGVLAWEWILERARKAGVPGGSAFRALGGYGRHRVLHEDRFIELAGDLPVEIGFAISDAEADHLLQVLAAEGVTLFYVRLPAEFGFIGEPPPTPKV